MNELVRVIESHVGVADVLATFTFIIAALYAWRDLNWRVRNLENWQAKLDRLMDQQVAILTSTDKNTTVLQEIMKGQERRIVILEDRESRQ